MTVVQGRLTAIQDAIPYYADVVRIKSLDRDSIGKVGREYQKFFNSLRVNTASLVNRSFPSELVNPDFGILSANGTNPVTEADGTNFELVSNWFIETGVGNTYTMTPTAFTQIPFRGTGSNYFLNINVSDLNDFLYLYNLNYSLTDQFNSLSKYNAQRVTFSTVIKNNSMTVRPKIRFSANIDGYGDVQGAGIYLNADSYDLISTSIQLPDLRDQLIAGENVQFRFNLEDLNGGTTDFDIYYLKAELSNFATPLTVNHVFEEFMCNNLV